MRIYKINTFFRDFPEITDRFSHIKTCIIALAPKPVLFVVGLSKGYGAQLIESSLL